MTVAARAPFAHEQLPTSIGNVLAFARREFRDALSSRWFILYTAAFSVLAVSTSFLSLAGVGSHGFAGFGRTAAGLLHLIMLVVPLMGITAGAGSIAGERERGTLIYLLAQPVARWEVLLGKFAGLAAALCSSLALGFGLSALPLAYGASSTGAGDFMGLVALTCMLAIAMLAVGLAISAISRKGGVALGLGLFVWLVLLFLSDLGLMAGTLMFRLRVQELFALALLNPLQAFKMAVILDLNASLDVLGPAGMYAVQTLGGSLGWILGGILILWTCGALGVAAIIFHRRAAT
jgi:Cu-processing system permease protein